MPVMPTLGAVTGVPGFDVANGVNVDLTALQHSEQQINADYSNPSANLKTAEALDKLKNGGQLDNFSNVTSSVGIEQSGGTTVATDPSTGSVKADLGPTPAQTAAANSNSVGVGEQSFDGKTVGLKVTISQMPYFSEATNTLVFDVMPVIQESRSVTYEPFSPLQHPGEILKYKSTASRSWSITAKFISRTSKEALRNRNNLNMIRAWAMPFFGLGTEASEHKNILGAPPPILTLTAYGNQSIGPVKCVLENYSNDWPNDVDYIPVDDVSAEPFPVIMNVSVTLKESWSPAEYSNFDIVRYRLGDMPGAFQKASMPIPGAGRGVVNPPTVAQSADVNAATPNAVDISRSEAASQTVADYANKTNVTSGLAGDVAKSLAGQGQALVSPNSGYLDNL